MRAEELIGLAQEPSSERRRELMDRVADLFLDGAERFTDRELLLFGDVLTSLLAQVAPAGRAALSERIADSAHAPYSVVWTLAADDRIEVAQPVLTRSPALDDDDLVAIASGKSQDHRLAISRRASLSEPVTDVLVAPGERMVLTAVSCNLGARFSPAGLDRLIAAAAQEEGIGIALLKRADLPAGAAERVYALLPETARRQLDDLSGDQAAGDSLVARASVEAREQRIRAATNRLGAKALVRDVRSGMRGLNGVIEELASSDRFLDLAFVMAEVSGIDESVVRNVLVKTDRTPLAVLAKAMHLSLPAYQAILDIRMRRLGQSSIPLDRQVEEFGSIDGQTAERTVRFVKLRTSLTRQDAAGAAGSSGREAVAGQLPAASRQRR